MNMRLSNITLKTQIQVKEQCFYGCSAFNSHSGIYNNEQNSYPKMSVKSVRHLLPDKRLFIVQTLEYTCIFIDKTLEHIFIDKILENIFIDKTLYFL